LLVQQGSGQCSDLAADLPHSLGCPLSHRALHRRESGTNRWAVLQRLQYDAVALGLALQ
jgi:hypothetical protein